jgi:hypothetical protein
VLALANAEGRILVTGDKDFGELVVRRRAATRGIVLLRLTAPLVQDRIDRLAAGWPTVEGHLPGRFIVVGDKKVRIRPLISSSAPRSSAAAWTRVGQGQLATAEAGPNSRRYALLVLLWRVASHVARPKGRNPDDASVRVC